MSKSSSGRVMLILLLSLCVLHAATTVALAERVSDPDGNVSVELPPGWQAVSPENIRETLTRLNKSDLRIIGVDPERITILAINAAEAKDIAPLVYVSRTNFGGLALSDDDIDNLRRQISAIYSEEMDSRFKLLTLEKSEIGGLPAARLTGIYRWRTVNIKLLQFLIPGTQYLHAVTYSAKEREFNRFLPEVESALETVRIADPPVVLDWLWNALRWIVLLGLVAGVIWLTMVAASSRGGGEGSSVSPFLRRK